jgi:hypothetical protein
MAMPIPPLNLNLSLAAQTGDFENDSTKMQTFAAPVINKTNGLLIAGVAVASIAVVLVAKKAGVF